MNVDDVIKSIGVLHKYGNIRCVAFSGGEPLLLGEKLGSLIKYVDKLGINSRVVSSGYWGRSRAQAEKIISGFIDSGLDELNISTGDYHSEFVSTEDVCNAAFMSAKAGIRTMVVVERHDKGKVSRETIERKLLKQKWNGKKPKYPIKIIENVIVPNKLGTCGSITEPGRNIPDKNKYYGCLNILSNISILPEGDIYACCGLTMKHTPELKIGHIDEFKHIHSRRGLQEFLLKNMLHLWLSVDGPERMAQLVEKEIGISLIGSEMIHRCHKCLALFSNQLSRFIIEEKAEEVKTRIILEYFQQEHIVSEVFS